MPEADGSFDPLLGFTLMDGDSLGIKDGLSDNDGKTLGITLGWKDSLGIVVGWEVGKSEIEGFSDGCDWIGTRSLTTREMYKMCMSQYVNFVFNEYVYEYIKAIHV